MAENSEKVGFEAFFETDEFKKGVTNFLKGTKDVVNASQTTGSVFKKMGNMIATAQVAITTALGAAVGTALGPGVGNAIGGAIGALVGTLQALITKTMFGIIDKLSQLPGKILKFLQPVADFIGGTLKFALKGLLAVIGAVAAAITGILVVAFIKLRDIVRNIFSEIKQQINAAIEAAVEFQTIEIGLEALIRTALVVDDAFATARDAMSAAIPIADHLKDILVNMSLTSPFPVDYIYEMYRVITAYGVAIDTAVDLTKGLIELGAATGFGKDVLERLAKNLSQVALNGRIFQRDVYELANAGLNLSQVLDEELGTTVDGFNEQLASGEASVNDLIDALINFSTKYYGGSAEQLALAVAGLQSRFETLKTVIATDFVQPIIAWAVPAIDTFIKALGEVYKIGTFGLFGEFFTGIMSDIVGDVDWTVDEVSVKIMEFFIWLVDMGSEMATNGQQMMQEWGYGMLEGAAEAITAVANFISSALTALFEVHSPPAILPLIDVWGAKTIESWLTGMTKADFGLINDVIAPVKQALTNLGLDNKSIRQNVQNVVRMLSESLDAGSISIGLYDMFDNMLGPYSDAMKDFLELQFDLANAENALADAVKNVEKAQKALDDAMDFYDEADNKVQKLVREYNALLRAGASDEVLDTKLDEINAVIGQREEAAELINQKEEELDVAKDARDEAQEYRDTLKEQADAQEELVNLMLDLTSNIDKAGGALEALQNETEKLLGGLGGFSINTEEMDSKLRQLKTQLAIKLRMFRHQISGWIQEISSYFTDPEGSWQTMLSSIGDLAGTINDIASGDIDFESVKQNLKEGIKAMWEDIDWEDVKQSITDAFGRLMDKIDWESLKTNIKIGVLKALIAAFAFISGEDLKEAAHSLGEKIGYKFEEWALSENGGAEMVKNIIKGITLAIGTYVVSIMEIGKSFIGGILDGMSEALEEKKPVIGAIFSALIDIIKFFWGIESPSTVAADEIGAPIAEGIVEGIEDIFTLEKAGEIAGDIFDNLSTAFTNLATPFYEIGVSVIGGILDGISEMGETNLITWAAGVAGSIISAIQNALDINTPSKLAAKEVGFPIAEGILSGTEKAMSGIKSDFMGAATSLLDYNPTPTNSYRPSAISNSNVVYNMNMGNNTVRSEADLALITNANRRAIQHASYGV